MTNKITEITLKVKNKKFIGEINNNKLSGNYNGKHKEAIFKNSMEAFNYLIDNCDLGLDVMSFRMFIPGWALAEYRPEHKKGAILNIDLGMTTGDDFYFSYDPGDDSDDYEILYVPFEMKTKNDIKKNMKYIFMNKKPSSSYYKKLSTIFEPIY